MLEALLARTSLPNFHPAVVHFPIALLVAALLVDLVAFLWHRRVWIASLGVVLWVAGALGAGLAVYTGGDADEMAGVADPVVLAAIGTHETWADRTLVAAIAAAVLRLVVAHVGRRRGAPWRLGHAVALVVGLAAAVLVGITADHGGALVYQHAVGVATAASGR